MATISVLGVFNADLKFTVNNFPKAGQTIHAESFAVQPGGKGFNQAVAARRAGAEVNMLTQLGEDEFASLAYNVMQKDAINSDHITSSNELPTGTAMIMLETASGENQIAIAAGAASLLTKSQIDEYRDVIAASDIFMTNFEVPFEIASHGLALARQCGTITVLDPAPALPVPDEVYRLVDYITPNETEASSLTGIKVETTSDAETAGRQLCQSGVGTAIVTLGGNGVVVVRENETFHIPAFAVEKVIDTTGAGDAFNGAFAASLAENPDLQSAIRFASAGAALAVTRNGAADAMAVRSDISKKLSA